MLTSALRRCAGGGAEWRRAVATGERLVGYAGSYASLRCLLADEVASTALTVRRLAGTRHPLLRVAKNVFYNGDNSVQTRGLVVMLVARAAKPSASPADDRNLLDSSQRSIAELTEVIYTANLMHRGVLDAEAIRASAEAAGLKLGNKLAILSGDLLLSSAASALARLGKPAVTSLIAQAIADMSAAELTDDSSEPLGFEAWRRKIYLRSGSLLAHSCQSAIILDETGDNRLPAFDFGREFAYSYALAQLCGTKEEESAMQDVPWLDADEGLHRQLIVDQRLRTERLLDRFPQSVATHSLRQLISALPTEPPTTAI